MAHLEHIRPKPIHPNEQIEPLRTWECGMRCEEIMKSDVECLSPTATAHFAARRMRDKKVGFLPICDAHGAVLGVVTDRDIIIRLVADNLSLETPVEEFMTREVISCTPRDDLRKAQRIMGENRVGRILCIDEIGRLCGVISLSDVAIHEESGIAAETMRQVSEREVRTITGARS